MTVSRIVNSGDTITFTTSSGYTTFPSVTVSPGFPAPFTPEITARELSDRIRATHDILKEKGTAMTSPSSRVGLKNAAPTTHQAARDEGLLLATDAQQTIDGWVGQVLIEGLPVWQSEAVPVQAPPGAAADYDPVAEALRAARTKVTDTFRTLFGASQAPAQSTGFTASQTPGA